jgi:hypothetical protein
MRLFRILLRKEQREGERERRFVLLLLFLLPMPTACGTSILHKSRGKTVLKPGKNPRAATCVYTVTAPLGRRVLIAALLELNLLAW